MQAKVLKDFLNLAQFQPHGFAMYTSTTPDFFAEVVNPCDAVDLRIRHVALWQNSAQYRPHRDVGANIGEAILLRIQHAVHTKVPEGIINGVIANTRDEIVLLGSPEGPENGFINVVCGFGLELIRLENSVAKEIFTSRLDRIWTGEEREAMNGGFLEIWTPQCQSAVFFRQQVTIILADFLDKQGFVMELSGQGENATEYRV